MRPTRASPTHALSEPRGRILDRNGVVLADTQMTDQGPVRHYADPSLVHTIGFHSDRFGDTNLEAVYDAELRGEKALSPWDELAPAAVAHPASPQDLVLTIDKRISDAAVQALGNSAGSIVAIDPRSGEVLAMVSTPYFDPNTADAQMAKLQSDPGQPLFNRSIQAATCPGRPSRPLRRRPRWIPTSST